MKRKSHKNQKLVIKFYHNAKYLIPLPPFTGSILFETTDTDEESVTAAAIKSHQVVTLVMATWTERKKKLVDTYFVGSTSTVTDLYRMLIGEMVFQTMDDCFAL